MITKNKGVHLQVKAKIFCFFRYDNPNLDQLNIQKAFMQPDKTSNEKNVAQTVNTFRRPCFRKITNFIISHDFS